MAEASEATRDSTILLIECEHNDSQTAVLRPVAEFQTTTTTPLSIPHRFCCRYTYLNGKLYHLHSIKKTMLEKNASCIFIKHTINWKTCVSKVLLVQSEKLASVNSQKQASFQFQLWPKKRHGVSFHALIPSAKSSTYWNPRVWVHTRLADGTPAKPPLAPLERTVVMKAMVSVTFDMRFRNKYYVRIIRVIHCNQ